LPLRAPFKIATRTAYEAQNVAITVETEDEGISGFGASAPVGYVTGESVDSVIAKLTEFSPSLAGMDIRRRSRVTGPLQTWMSDAPAARAGLEMALYDAWAKSHGISLWDYFGGAIPVIRTDITIPLTTPEEARSLIAGYADVGLTTYKIKVGSEDGPTADLARIAAIVDAAPRCRLRIDANQAFSVDDAITFIHRLTQWSDVIELVEQPVARDDTRGLWRVRQESDLPIFADESVCSPADARHLIESDAVDGINIKLMKCGIEGAVDIIAQCRAHGIKLMIGCMLETSLGITAAAFLSAGCGAFDYNDLDSQRLLSPVPGLTAGFGELSDEIVISPDGHGWGCSVPSEIFLP